MKVENEQAHHTHPLFAAILDPNEILEETRPLIQWLTQMDPHLLSHWNRAKDALEAKDAPVFWPILEHTHLRFPNARKDLLLAWQLCQNLNRAYHKWVRYGYPYRAITQPPPLNAEECEQRCREALMLTIAFHPFLKDRPSCPKENETARHFLALTLISCLQRQTPALHITVDELKERAYGDIPIPPLPSQNERTDILANSILLMAYGGQVSPTQWSRPTTASLAKLLHYLYSAEGFHRIEPYLPEDTKTLHDELKKLNLI